MAKRKAAKAKNKKTLLDYLQCLMEDSEFILYTPLQASDLVPRELHSNTEEFLTAGYLL